MLRGPELYVRNVQGPSIKTGPKGNFAVNDSLVRGKLLGIREDILEFRLVGVHA